MPNQDAPKASPQQLSLDLDPGSADARAKPTVQTDSVSHFIDAGTLSIRKQALERVKAAKIFPVPTSRSR